MKLGNLEVQNYPEVLSVISEVLIVTSFSTIEV